MKTLCDAILNYAEVDSCDAKCSCKDSVLAETEIAVCRKTAKGYAIKEGRTTLGRGVTKDAAWEDASLTILNIQRKTVSI